MSKLTVGLALASCAAIGAVGALDPRAFLVVLALGALMGLCVLAYRQPRRLLSFSVLLVLVAGTKFRNRDATASLSDTVDGLIVLELGLYAVVALIVFNAVIAPTFPRRRLDVRERLLVGFAALAFASTLWSDAPMLTLVRAAQLTILLALALVAIRVLDVAGTVHALGTAIVRYVLVSAAITVAFPATRVTGTVALANERFSWFAIHSISASTFTAIAILYLLCVGLFLPGGWLQRRAGLPVVVALVPLSAIMVATNSRGPLFALLGAVAAVVALRAFRPITSLTLAALASLAVLAASIVGVTPTSVLEDAARSRSAVATLVLRGQDIREFGTMTGRTELWADVFPLYLSRPITGYGYQASRAVLLQLRPWAGHAHNAFLQTLLDLGLVGAVLLWIPFLSTLFSRPRARSPDAPEVGWSSASVFAASIFTLLNSVTDVGFAGAPGYEILLFLCAVIAAERLARTEAPAAAIDRAASVWERRAAPTVV